MRMHLAIACLLLSATAHAADITSTRVTSYDWQCQKADGTKISDHARFDTALIACLNANGSLIQGGRYRIAVAGSPPPVTPPVVTPPVVTPPAASGTAALTWSAPTLNTDGTAVKTPVTFKVYHGKSADSLIESIPIAALAYNFTGLPAGTHYFAVSAVTADGESALSGVGSKVIQ